MCNIQQVSGTVQTSLQLHTSDPDSHKHNVFIDQGLQCLTHGVRVTFYGMCPVGVLESQVEELTVRLKEMERLINVWKGHD